MQPIQNGAGFLDLTYDYHGQSTFAYTNAPANVTVPFSSTRYSTFSLTGNVAPAAKLALNFGLYTHGLDPVRDSSRCSTRSGALIGTAGLGRAVARSDPHLALVARTVRTIRSLRDWNVGVVPVHRRRQRPGRGPTAGVPLHRRYRHREEPESAARVQPSVRLRRRPPLPLRRGDEPGLPVHRRAQRLSAVHDDQTVQLMGDRQSSASSRRSMSHGSKQTC